MLTNLQKDIAAAITGLSNMGLALPDDHEVDYLRRPGFKGRDSSLNDCVEHLCGQYMETDHLVEVFYEEASMWRREIEKGFTPRPEIMALVTP